MGRAIYIGYRGLAWAIFAAVLVQFFLAGVGVFGKEAFGEEAIGPHVITGLLLLPASLLLLILAGVSTLTGTLKRGRVKLAAALFALLILQMLLGGLAQDISPFVAALHPVNALLVLGVSFSLARGRRLSQVTERRIAEKTATPDRVV